MNKKYIILVFFLFFVTKIYSDTTKVLFIGNSYTYVNDLPLLFTQLSASGNKIVQTDMNAPGGYTLEQHKTDANTLSKIRQGIWNYVVLQEQSQTPVIEYLRYNSMYPSARWLDSLIKANNGNTAFYMTWGRKYGGQQCIGAYCSPVFSDFYHMQDSLKSSYKMISDSLNSLLCPVGEAWKRAKQIDSTVDLWQSDDSHPTLKGSYLAACVFYSAIFHVSPVGLTYTGGLSSADALFFQQCAWYAVTGINNHSINIPAEFYLEQNYPNPFNPETKIRFKVGHSPSPLSRGDYITLKIYDILGREITTLINSNLQPGNYEINWNAENLPGGIYYCTLSAGKFILTRKMIFLK